MERQSLVASESLQIVLAYHEASKHHFHAFARSTGYLDWATQPAPFRRYEGAQSVALERSVPVGDPTYRQALGGGGVPVQALDLISLARLFRDSLSLSAWKQLGGERWALRVNPSSGNLHPTEGYLVSGPLVGLSKTPAVWHYSPREHALELRAQLPADLWAEIAAGLPPGSLLVGLSSIHWREAWKYGERAFRYCQHDVGHAVAAVAIAAAGLGWHTSLLEAVGHDVVTALLGLSGSTGPEREVADCLLLVQTETAEPAAGGWSETLVARCRQLTWCGQPNRLSPSHRLWPAVERMADVVRKPDAFLPFPDSSVVTRDRDGLSDTSDPLPDPSLRRIIHQRRSAVAMDGRSAISRAGFLRLLARLQAANTCQPFAALPWSPAVHLFLFVHRVQDFAPGLYCLVRDRNQQENLQKATRNEFIWQEPDGCPAGLSLYLLQAGDLREKAREVSCGQAIAGDGCFSLSMVADFTGSLRRFGPWFYSRLFWECGLIGQVLYLEAEVAGLRGTGIGCFFDDPVHDLLGLQGNAFQSLYHFTVGGPLEDARITTLPPYP